MITSGYMVILSCDCCRRPAPMESPAVATDSFYAGTHAAASRLAHTKGWDYRLRGTRPYLARCPTCRALGRPFPETEVADGEENP